MNIVLWILQALLALHTIIGGVWKFTKTAAETMPSLQALTDGIWRTMGVLELMVGLCFVLPAVSKALNIAAPLAACFVILEMLLFCGLQLFSGTGTSGSLAYWLVVAGICVLIAYGRFVIKP
jgi:uncharacterized membrane protein